jgi:prepilin peptidase CpaA
VTSIAFTPPAAAIEIILIAAVLTAAVTDIRWRRIPNWLTASVVLIGFVVNPLVHRPHSSDGLWLATAGFVLAFGLNLAMYALHMTGAGDVKLMAAIGALVGCSDFLGIFFLNAAIGGIIGLALVVRGRRLRTTLWNVTYMAGELMRWRAPYLSREALDVRSPRAVTLPRAVPICLGTLVFLMIVNL